MKNYQLRKTMCATCPFRPGSPYENLAADLAASALSDASRICHSTGSNGIHARTGLPSHICRGARDVQLSVMVALKVIDALTDDAWNEAREKVGLPATVVADPRKKGAKRVHAK